MVRPTGVFVYRKPGQQGISGRRTGWIGGKRVRVVDPIGGDRIQMRGLNIGISGHAEAVPTVLVPHDEEDIGTISHGLGLLLGEEWGSLKRKEDAKNKE